MAINDGSGCLNTKLRSIGVAIVREPFINENQAKNFPLRDKFLFDENILSLTFDIRGAL